MFWRMGNKNKVSREKALLVLLRWPVWTQWGNKIQERKSHHLAVHWTFGDDLGTATIYHSATFWTCRARPQGLQFIPYLSLYSHIHFAFVKDLHFCVTFPDIFRCITGVTVLHQQQVELWQKDLNPVQSVVLALVPGGSYGCKRIDEIGGMVKDHGHVGKNTKKNWQWKHIMPDLKTWSYSAKISHISKSLTPRSRTTNWLSIVCWFQATRVISTTPMLVLLRIMAWKLGLIKVANPVTLTRRVMLQCLRGDSIRLFPVSVLMI